MKLQKAYFLFIFILLLANVFVWQEVLREDNNLKVVFFDVGQGDSIFVETPEGHQILIDGGPSGKRILEKLSKEIPFWDKTIDLVILTHPDYDHLAGLNYVLRRYRVKNILWSGIEKNTKTYQYWIENLKKEKKEGGKIVIAERGQIVKAGEAELYIFYPFESLESKLFDKSSNDSSVVAKLTFGNSSFFLPGDITEKTEKKLISENSSAEKIQQLRSSVLKVAHHGSKNSTSREFLEEVLPEIAVISVGKNNSYGHPHEKVLRRLEDFGIKVLRTDIKGDIKIISNGNYLEIR